ncbi:hypothetical protein BHE74_00050980 [Ensete ventricosum]|nr:hypothetical protein BHE74_00050980 [Ensete ventricosum]
MLNLYRRRSAQCHCSTPQSSGRTHSRPFSAELHRPDAQRAQENACVQTSGGVDPNLRADVGDGDHHLGLKEESGLAGGVRDRRWEAKRQPVAVLFRARRH